MMPDGYGLIYNLFNFNFMPVAWCDVMMPSQQTSIRRSSTSRLEMVAPALHVSFRLRRDSP